MKIKVERRWPKATYTIGRFYIDGILYCNTLEDADRGLKQTDALSYIKSRKVAGETAIPKGDEVGGAHRQPCRNAGRWR